MQIDESGFVIEEHYSPWQKKKVRTFLVNTHAKSTTQKSIGAAIAMAKPYDRIELAGGDYAEAITIPFPLELVASEGEEPRILSRNSCITVTADVEVLLENLVVVSNSTSKLDAAVVLMAGSTLVTSCRVNSVLIGGSATPRIERCVISHSASGYGLLVQDSGGGVVHSTRIFAHRAACVEVDTRGELQVTESTLYNYINLGGGDVVVVSGLASAAGRDGSAAYACCSHVQFTHCHLYVSADEPPSGGGGGIAALRGERGMNGVAAAVTSGGVAGVSTGGALTTTSVPCCALIENGAAPQFTSNEFLEGEVGFLFDDAGAAQLKGNIIRCQRRCGVLALVQEGFAYVQGHQTLRITGDNVIDRCYIGIDVQCVANRSSALLAPLPRSDRLLSTELPNAKRAFHWMTTLSNAAAGVGGAERVLSSGVHSHNDTPTSVATLTGRLRALATLALEAHPTALQPSFGLMAGASYAADVSASSPRNSGNPVADLLHSTLGTNLSGKKSEEAVEQMLRLRGNRGVDVVNTKFSSCGVCAIRFGRQGYGLVEECIFEDCGTHAIVMDSASHPLVTGCRFLRSSGAAILVGNLAHPLIIGNEFAGGRGNALAVTAVGKGIVLGNLLANNQGTGLQLEKHSVTVVAGNGIAQNRGGGVLVDGGSEPTLLCNVLSGNAKAQIMCTNASDAFIAHNRIQSGPGAGVLVQSCSRCTIASNEIVANAHGILVELDADPVVEDNVLLRNLQAGVLCRNNGLGTFVGNTIGETGSANVLVQDGASPVFRANTIEKAAQGGIVVIQEGGGVFAHNKVADNAVANVLVADLNTDPEVVSNALFGSPGCGVICTRSAAGTFTKNNIYENKQCGVYIVDAAQPTFTNNTVAREAVGVLFSDGGKGRCTDNRIEGCHGAGVITQRQAEPLFQNNTVVRCGMSGVQVAPDGLGVFTDNEFAENDVGVQLGSSLQSAQLDLQCVYLAPTTPAGEPGSSYGAGGRGKKGSVAFSRDSGKSVLQNFAAVAVARRASMTKAVSCVLQHNRIHHNRGAGVLLESSANGVVEENEIYRNDRHGVRGDTEYSAKKAQEILSAMYAITTPVVRQGAAMPSRGTSAVLRKNKLYEHRDANVFVTHMTQTDVTVEGNTLYDAPTAIYVGNHSELPIVRGNEIYSCFDGVYVDSGGRGRFTANHVHHCQYVGLYVSDLGEPEWGQDNRIEDCGVCGIMVDVGGRGVVTHAVVRHCLVGVVVFCGPTTPNNITLDEVIRARLVSSAPTFTHNVIEENELHGVLLLSVISGCPLRTPRGDQLRVQEEAEKSKGDHPPSHFEPYPYQVAGVGAIKDSQGEHRLCPYFAHNTVQRNRLFGVYHDRFEPWDFDALDCTHAERRTSPSPGAAAAGAAGRAGGAGGAGGAVKNAYGGYEVLLGTSPVNSSDDHHRQREAKQVSFVENTITECGIGFGAGYGCHPFLLRNRIVKNYFFGLFLRFGSAVMTHGCEIGENGVAGVYAASGAKGFLTKGRIYANNGCCRPPERPHMARDFSTAIFARDFSPAAALLSMCVNGWWETEVGSDVGRLAELAYEQVRSLLGVQTYTVEDGLRILCEVVAASSAGMSFATGCAPSSLVLSSGGGGGVAPKGGIGRGDDSVGGIGVPQYVPTSSADGGIGVWVERGSRTTINANLIEQHTNVGVFLSKGVPQHHRSLHAGFAMEVAAPSTTRIAAGAAGGGETAARQGRRLWLSSDRVQPPALASNQAGVLFSPQPLCASGIIAAVQVAAANSDLLETSASMATVFHTVSASMLMADTGEVKDAREDSIHHALVDGNTITRNGRGVYLEVFSRLRYTGTGNGAALTDGQRAGAATSPRARPTFLVTVPSPATPETAVNIDATDAAVMEESYDRVDFTIVIRGNTIHGNRGSGVWCQHMVEVHCDTALPNRGALNERVEREYEGLRAQLVLKKTPTTLSGGEVPFRVAPVPRKVSHALIAGNTLHDNQGYQAEITSRYIAVAKDMSRTLLQCDTLAVPQASNYASRVLVHIPLYASLLQLPPPSLVLWEGNTFKDSKHGMHVVGYLGPRSIRVEQNTFTHLADDAVYVEGHLAACTVGAGNRFDRSSVAVRVNVDVPPAGAASTSTLIRCDLRTRVFRNQFMATQNSAVLVDGTGESTVLVYRNEFSDHALGSAALLLSTGTRVLVSTNVFRDSFSPVVLCGAGGKATEEGAASTASALLVENYFYNNYIGALVCDGATPRLLRNLFDCNHRAGLEIVGTNTRPTVESCVFRRHKRSMAEEGDLAASVSMARASGTFQQSASVVTLPTTTTTATMHYPEQGRVSLRHGTLVVLLAPGNRYVLSPNSQVVLPAGVLLSPLAEGLLEECVFYHNDVGVDAVREPVSQSMALKGGGSSAMFKTCVFANNEVAGVLARGIPSQGTASPNTTAATLRGASSRTPTPAPPGTPASAGGTSGAAVPTSALIAAMAADDTPPETTVFDSCYFVKNGSLDGTGDVVAMSRGYVSFRQCVFYGAVHAKAEAIALFVDNTFAALGGGSGADGANGAVVEEREEGGEASEGAVVVSTPALVLHEGSHVQFEKNTVVGRRIGVDGLPGAMGKVTANRVIHCTTAIHLAPYCRTIFSQNRLLGSRDCGVVAYGGVLYGNEVFGAPTGMVVQNPTSFKGINAIPMSMRGGGGGGGSGAQEQTTAKNNMVSACDGDGILVAGIGTFEGNTITHCRNGVNVVCPANSDAGGKGPLIKSNTVYDNAIGIYLDNNSCSTVQDNEVFDNAELGVLVLPTATGTLQGNHLSSPGDHGAAEIPTDARVKSLGNVIRNQFSPAFNRETRAGRLKEFQTKCDLVDKERQEVVTGVTTLARSRILLTAAAEAVMAELVDLHTRPVTEDRGHLAGAASRSLRQTSVARALTELDEASLGASPGGGGGGGAGGGSGKRDRSTTSPAMPPRGGSAARKGRSASPTTTPSRRSSVAAAAARKKVQPRGVNQAAASGASPLPVLIHVFTAADTHTVAGATGQAVARVLAAAPMSAMNLVTTVTTSSTQLLDYLRNGHNPCIAIVVVDGGHKEFTTLDREALQQLHSASCVSRLRPSRRRASDTSLQLSFTLLPKAFSLRSSAATASEGGMSVKEYSEAHTPLLFGSGVETVLDELRSKLAEGVQLHRSSAQQQRRPSQPLRATLDAPSSADDSDTDTAVDHGYSVSGSGGGGEKSTSDLSRRGSRIGNNPSSSGPGGPPRRLSREHIGNLLSLLTPEALGFDSAQPRAKRRKSSVSGASAAAAAAASGDGAKGRTSRRVSFTAAAAPQAPHAASPSTARKDDDSAGPMKRKGSVAGGGAGKKRRGSNAPASRRGSVASSVSAAMQGRPPRSQPRGDSPEPTKPS